jgi:hypothetical protein
MKRAIETKRSKPVSRRSCPTGRRKAGSGANIYKNLITHHNHPCGVRGENRVLA